MQVIEQANGFTFEIGDHEYREEFLIELMEWCSEHATDWDYELESITSYRLHDPGEGFSPTDEYWVFKLTFGRTDDALMFKLSLDGILAGATC